MSRRARQVIKPRTAPRVTTREGPLLPCHDPVRRTQRAAAPRGRYRSDPAGTLYSSRTVARSVSVNSRTRMRADMISSRPTV